MKPYQSFSLILILGFSLLTPRPTLAVGGDEETAPLCLPGVYPTDQENCLTSGPSQYLTDMAAKGITFPQSPLPVRKPNPELTQINYQYAYVVEDRSPIYRTLNDAVHKKADNIARRTIPGFNYVAYTKSVHRNGRRFFQTEDGWMSSEDVIPTSVPKFQGVEFSQTPRRPFGWVLNYFSSAGKVETKRTPGFDQDDYTGHVLDHLEMVWIYDVKTVGKWNWYMVGPDEWIFQTSIAKVNPNPTPPQGEDWNRWIEVNLYEQTVTAYERGELVFATLMASGTDPYPTYPGKFRIYEKLNTTDMRGTFAKDRSDWYYLENVPWTMYFDDRRALHGAYWRARLGYPQSHGCVNMTVGDARWLYEWAEVGDWVYVHDPSGKTPTQ